MPKGSDFGFVGDAYSAPAPYQDSEICVNWYVEIAQTKNAKTPTALLGCPGLQTLLTLGSGPVRGCWELPGGQQSLWVSGNQVYVVTVQTPATATTLPVLTAKLTGTPIIDPVTGATTGYLPLLSNNGPVVIRDGGASGYAWIVDGPNGYLYHNSTQHVALITDPAFLGADRCAFIDGWMVFNEPNSQTFYTNYPQYGVLPFNGTYFALKDGATDLLVTLYENKEELWLIGEKTTEIWYDAGGQYFPFQRLVSTMIQVGCCATHSIARFASEGQEGLIWLSKSERGQYTIVKTVGFSCENVATPAISDAIAKYPVVSDAIGYVYQEDGHEFYMLTFPTADKTWVFDGSTNKWHQRASYDPVLGLFHRHRSNCHLNFQGMHLVGDYQNGNMYLMSRSLYTDAGQPLVAWRRTPHIWDGGSRRRQRYHYLQLDFRIGVGLVTGQGSMPRVMLKWSDDSGSSYGDTRLMDLGQIGATRGRADARRLGTNAIGHDRVFDVRVSDPCSRDVVGATLF